MATSGRRGVLLRSLPVLLLLALMLSAAPQPASTPPRAAAGCTAAAVPSSSTQEDPAAEPSANGEQPADRVTALAAQSTASARACRAPPVASR